MEWNGLEWNGDMYSMSASKVVMLQAKNATLCRVFFPVSTATSCALVTLLCVFLHLFHSLSTCAAPTLCLPSSPSMRLCLLAVLYMRPSHAPCTPSCRCPVGPVSHDRGFALLQPRDAE